MKIKLPKNAIPSGYYRKFDSGIDLPSYFYDNLKGIDKDFYLIWHPHRVLWDDIINIWVGSLDDPRFTINNKFGHLNFGFVLTNGDGSPQPDNSFHLWRYSNNAPGWVHILKIQSKDPAYLDLILTRLNLQARVRDKYGDRAWNQQLSQETLNAQQYELNKKQELFSDVQNENKSFMKKAMENFASGRTAPTNPVVESIISYGSQKNRTRTSRPADDRDGGLVIPEKF